MGGHGRGRGTVKGVKVSEDKSRFNYFFLGGGGAYRNKKMRAVSKVSKKLRRCRGKLSFISLFIALSDNFLFPLRNILNTPNSRC